MRSILKQAIYNAHRTEGRIQYGKGEIEETKGKEGEIKKAADKESEAD